MADGKTESPGGSTGKKTTFFLTNTAADSEKSSEKPKAQPKFAKAAKKILMANRAFPALQSRDKVDQLSLPRKGSRNQSISLTQSEFAGGRIMSMGNAPSESGESSRLGRRELCFENSYKMVPDQNFTSGKTKGFIHQILEEELKDIEYSADKCKELSLRLSEVIKARVKENWLVDRFKIVCVVHVGKPFGQGMQITSRCLWNPAFDTFASDTFKTDQIFAQASVFAVYVE